MQEKQFVEKGVRRVKLHEYLEEELEGAGYSKSEVVRTPTSTKIIIHAQRPGLIIGRGGSRIRELTETMEEEFDFENPQIEVNEIEEPDTDAEIVAKSMASWLEKGGQPKRVGYTYLRRMREAGVIGAEIEISGKLSGNRGRTEKFSYGYVKICGNTAEERVDTGYKLAKTQPGAIGVKVRIMKEMPDFMHRDVDVEEEIFHKTEEHGETEPREKRIEKVVAEADNMTAAGIEEAMETLEGTETEGIDVSEIREVYEERGDEIKSQAEEEDQKSESAADEEAPDPDAEESEEEEMKEDIDYDEIVSGTISDAKDGLEDLASPDWKKALEAEEENKNRTTFIDWLETRVEE